jgi:alkanesulfonate monooxygenase SsuD/methylene tetrahydromethanopterin reductase-like flavin-dependent oxidoreductase (luciferase family)
MRYGLEIPNGGECADPHFLAELAQLAEEAGWDGIFLEDYICYYSAPDAPTCDPWVALAGMALRTRRIRLGTTVTPLSRRRPWKLARETVTLDHLSGGRLVLGVGLGGFGEKSFTHFGEVTDGRQRAEMLDESLDILAGLWSGQPFSYRGKHYSVEEVTFLPRPVQSPRIPIWVIGAWPRRKSMARALRYDGVIPVKAGEDNAFWAMLTPDDVRELRAYIAEQRPETTPFDIVLEGATPGDNPEEAAAKLRPYAEAGLTWWLESVWEAYYSSPNELDEMRARIRQGPVRVG